MEFNYRYQSSSHIANSAAATALAFEPDTLREPTYFVGRLAKPLAFREPISALNAVVVSDLRFQPKDRTEYQAWLQQHETDLLAEFMADQGDLQNRVRDLRHELNELYRSSNEHMRPYYKAQPKSILITFTRPITTLGLCSTR